MRFPDNRNSCLIQGVIAWRGMECKGGWPRGPTKPARPKDAVQLRRETVSAVQE